MNHRISQSTKPGNPIYLGLILGLFLLCRGQGRMEDPHLVAIRTLVQVGNLIDAKTLLDQAKDHPHYRQWIEEWKTHIHKEKEKAKKQIEKMKLTILTTPFDNRFDRYFYQLAYFYEWIDNYPLAKKYYRFSLENNPENVSAKIRLAYIDYRMGKKKQYFRSIEKIYSENPKNPYANFYYAIALLHQHRWEEAGRMANKLKENWPRFAHTIRFLIQKGGFTYETSSNTVH